MQDFTDYFFPVHRALLRRVLFFGMSIQGLMIIFVVSVLMIVQLQQYWFLLITVILIAGLRILIRKDEYFIEIIISILREPDYLEAE